MDYLDRHPFVRSTVIDKVYGIILGSALGDAIGLYTEFLSKTMAKDAYPERKFSLVQPATRLHGDSSRDRYEPGSWTDDTDHALLILLSYLHNNGQLLPDEFAGRIATWPEQGLLCLDRLPLGLGNTVASVVLTPSFRSSPAEVSHKYWEERRKQPAANGSLMRTHPLGIMCLPMSREATYEIAMKYSQLTHFDPRCTVACCINTRLISGILKGEVEDEKQVDEVIEDAFNWVYANSDAEGSLLDRQEFERHVYATNFKSLELDDSMKMGYVYKSLGTAILCLRLAMRQPRTDTNVFERLITDLIMEGGDADTNACCAAALVGAWVGYASLPPHWRGGIDHREWLERKTDALCQVVGITQGDYSGKDDKDTLPDGGRGWLGKDQLDKRERDLLAKMLKKQGNRKQLANEKKGNFLGLGSLF